MKPDHQPVASSTDPFVPHELQAGPLTLIFEKGWIRCVRLGNVEIIRRVYFAVRDAYWNTIPGTIEDFTLQRFASSFDLTFASRHRRDDIDFLWHAEVSGEASGEINYSGRGIALSSFKRKRIGLCVLHPLRTCKGIPCRIESVGGETELSAFPRDIAPHQPFRNIRALSYAVASGLDATVRFEGDIFETEDQRNWTDATYKTYSTPLSLPAPVQLETGTLVHQKVTINLDKPTAPLIHIPLSLQLELSTDTLTGSIPRIGVLEPSRGCFDPAAVARTNAIGLSHLRTDLFPARGDLEAQISSITGIARALDCPIELAVHFGGDPGREAEKLAQSPGIATLPLSRILVYHFAEKSVGAATVAAVSKALRTAFPATPLAGGTDGYFVEINRVRPPIDLLDAVTYAATPQVHTFDETAIMENLPGLQETLDAAASFAPGKDIIISPLTLRPRKNSLIPEKDGGYDDRYSSLFAASWLAGALAYCVLGRASSVTIGERCGPGGVFSMDGPERYPLYFPLALIASDTGAPAECRLSSDPERAIALQWRRNNIFYALVINLSAQPCRITVRGVPGNCQSAVLDNRTAEAVISGSDPKLEGCRIPAGVKNNTCSLDLPPYALALLSASA